MRVLKIEFKAAFLSRQVVLIARLLVMILHQFTRDSPSQTPSGDSEPIPTHFLILSLYIFASLTLISLDRYKLYPLTSSQPVTSRGVFYRDWCRQGNSSSASANDELLYQLKIFKLNCIAKLLWIKVDLKYDY